MPLFGAKISLQYLKMRFRMRRILKRKQDPKRSKKWEQSFVPVDRCPDVCELPSQPSWKRRLQFLKRTSQNPDWKQDPLTWTVQDGPEIGQSARRLSVPLDNQFPEIVQGGC